MEGIDHPFFCRCTGNNWILIFGMFHTTYNLENDSITEKKLSPYSSLLLWRESVRSMKGGRV